ncbi:MAG: TonB-dependent receptor [Acidobacteria bacterium]|nr:TonB-dependent receptor [Acidobacteriota bacterium]
MKICRRTGWAFFLIPLVLASPGLVASAAAQGAGGVITGTVRDAQGGVLPGVTLTLRNVESGAVRTAVSEANGTYRLPGLPPGRYDLVAELAGFANAAVQDITITIGLELQRDLTMALQALQETVSVTAEAPVIETTQTEVGSVITNEMMDMLPIPDRQAISLALLLPGTSMDATSVRRSQANIGAGGANNQMNAYHADGVMNWSNNSGQQHHEIPQAAIREFRVNISQATAEYGGNVAGVVSTVTKSGTNQFHGEIFEFFRDTSLNRPDKFQQERIDRFGEEKPDYRRHQIGGGFGGPIIRDRLHFFGAIETRTEDKNFTVDTGQPRFYGALHGTFPTQYKRRQYLVRADLQVSSQQSLFWRYSYDFERIDCEDCGGTNAAFSDTFVQSPRDQNVVAHTWVIGSRMLNEIRTQLPPSHLNHRAGPPGTDLWPPSRKYEFPPERFAQHTPIFEFPSLNWGANGWSMNWTDRLELRDDFSYSPGNHTWKFGGAYVRLSSPEEISANVLGTWIFDDDQFFDGTAAAMANLRNPIQFTASFPPLQRQLHNHWIQWYVQDQWRVRTNLTVELGIRYDNQYKSFNQELADDPVEGLQLRPRLRELIDPASRGDHNNFGPRLGFAWDVRSDGRSVVRGAYGRFYQYVMQGQVRPEHAALRQSSINIRNPGYPDPYGGLSPEAFVRVSATPNVSILDDDLRNASGDTATVGFSQELRPNLAVHVDGVYTNIRDLGQIHRINMPDPVTGLRPRPTWGVIQRRTSAGEHEYRSLFVRLDRRFANRHQYLLSYTLSKQDNNDPTGNLIDFYNPGLNWGPGSADRRHNFVASGSVLLPFDVTVGAVWTLRSTMPFSALAGQDLNRDGASNTDLVPGATRNMGNRNNARMLELVNAWRVQNRRAPITEAQLDTNEFNRFDVRASKGFGLGGGRQIELIAQVFNLFGKDNLGGIGVGWTQNALSNSFGRISSALPRQEAELAVRFRF